MNVSVVFTVWSSWRRGARS